MHYLVRLLRLILGLKIIMNNTPNWNYWKLRPNAPAENTYLGSFQDMKDSGAKEFVFGKGKSAFSMFVIYYQDTVYGYLNICPHSSLPLNYRKESFLNKDKTYIRCTMHFAEFDIVSGYCIAGAAEKCYLDPIPIRKDNGNLYIDSTILKERI